MVRHFEAAIQKLQDYVVINLRCVTMFEFVLLMKKY